MQERQNFTWNQSNITGRMVTKPHIPNLIPQSYLAIIINFDYETQRIRLVGIELAQTGRRVIF